MAKLRLIVGENITGAIAPMRFSSGCCRYRRYCPNHSALKYPQNDLRQSVFCHQNGCYWCACEIDGHTLDFGELFLFSDCGVLPFLPHLNN